ncbi:restriction endonuclease subunit S [Streptomyces coeruleorubidus]|uniref:restriction endonuclease subunit S n=1 Tax=Streptomyces coeruleorubidus TaxID=116188 RepID=UPI0036F7FB5C
MTEANLASDPVWPQKSLAQLGARVTSGSRGWAKYYSDHGDLFVRITNLRRTSTRLDLSSPRYLQVDPDDAEARRTRLRPGDILISITADIGIIGLVDETVPDPAYINQHIARVRLDPKLADSRFISYFLASWAPQRRFVGATDQGAKAGMNLTAVANLTAAVPPLAEQVAIADALDTAVAQIEALECLIAKKRNTKQSLMQQLLTGRTRLPGFSDPWKELLVSDLLEFKNGLNKASRFFGHGTPIVNFMDVMRAPVITAERVKGLVSLSREEIGRFAARRGDMFFTRTSESVEEIGTAGVLVDDIPNAVFSGFVLRGRPIAPVNTTFLAYQFQLPSVRKQVIATASYTTRALTNGGSLGRVRVLVPSTDEQAAVVAVLADADAELAALERRLESAQALKTGMMQELLTGRTRLPVEAAS